MNQQSRRVKREAKHIAHRLKSIAFDARRCEQRLGIVEDVLDDNELGEALSCYANLRCGEWYLPPQSYFRRRQELQKNADAVGTSHAATSCCYFKSSDGHYRQPGFSTTRLNLHLLHSCFVARGDASALGSGKLIVVVDATQHGKKFPDSLSKTIPIWASVISEVYCCQSDGPSALFPPWVTRQEVAHITDRIPEWAEAFRHLSTTHPAEQYCLRQRLRTVWLHAEEPEEHWAATMHDVVMPMLKAGDIVFCLVSASGDPQWVFETPANDGNVGCGADHYGRNGWVYVRGAADDHQSWSMGLTASLFWSNVRLLTDDTASLDDITNAVAWVTSSAAAESPPVGAVESSASRGTGANTQMIMTPQALWCDIFEQSRGIDLYELLSCGVRVVYCSWLNGAWWRAACESSSADEWAAVPTLFIRLAKLSTPAPVCERIADCVARISIDPWTTNYGVERSLSDVLRYVTQFCAAATKSVIAIGLDAPGDASGNVASAVLGAVAVAVRVALSRGSGTIVDKALLRSQQSAVSEILGPESIKRSLMTQVNRFFTSRYVVQQPSQDP